MIKQYVAFTREIDNPEAAVQEILEQLKPEENMQKNTIGIVHFYHEFAETGVCQAVAKALPFELAGCVSSYLGAGGQYSDVALSVTMLTGNDVSFSIRTIENVNAKSGEQVAGEVVQLCTELCAKEDLKMVFPFLTPQTYFSGDDLVAAANALPKPVPFFGTVSLNMENKEGPHYTFANGNVSSDMFTFVAFYGGIEPKFHHTTSFVFDDDFSSSDEITDASGPVLKTVNGISALEYLKKQGILNEDNSITNSSTAWVTWAIPAILTYPNGTKVVRAFLGVVEDSESLFATGSMGTGAKITFGFLNGDKTLASAEKILKELIESKENNAIAYSCAARAWSLGSKYFAESQIIAKGAEEYEQKNNTVFNYNVAYSGGEICPVWDKNGNMVNTLHNFTLIICTFN